jgi:hypothetical protein
LHEQWRVSELQQVRHVRVAQTVQVQLMRQSRRC